MFPVTDPHATGMLQVSGVHSIYWETSGSLDGLPLLILHGGPGGPFGPAIRSFYDPSVFRVVYFHQRGAGRSTPLGEISENTTWDLVSDIEKLRLQLGISRWIVAGGSWGSTLALAYGQRHPESCLAFLLNGVFLGRRRDVNWFLEVPGSFFPEAWDRFVQFLPPGERTDVLGSYRERILSPDLEISRPAVLAWSAYEGSIAALQPDPKIAATFADPAFALAYARMNVHYFSNGCFLDDHPLLEGVEALAETRAIVVHGRYDLATPYRSAVELCAVWHSAELVTVPAGGHSRFDPPIGSAMSDAARRLAQQIRRE